MAGRLQRFAVAVDSATLADASRTVQRLSRHFEPSARAGTGAPAGKPSQAPSPSPTSATRASDRKAAVASDHRHFVSDELPHDIAGLRSWITAGRISVAEALSIQRDSIRSGDRFIHSVARFCDGTLPQDASAPLAGVGLAHKDNIACGEFAPGNGLPESLRPHAAPPMAPVIARLQAGGAEQLATLVMAERACGATAENHHFEPVVNPVDDSLFVGGSSSGSAAAVAAGLCYGALGTDTAGSVRIPAASCGLFGLKPSRGVLAGEGVAPLAPSLDTVGLLARSAADLQALYLAAGAAEPSLPADPQALRIANALDLDRMAPTVADTLESAMSRLGRMQPVRTLPMALPRAVSAYGETVFYYEAGRQHRAALASPPAALNTVARLLCTQGLLLPEAWYTRALAERPGLREAFIPRHFGEDEIQVNPAFSLSVPEHRQVSFADPSFDPAVLLETYRWMMPASVLDLPALVMPVGTDALGRPVSVQLLARPGSEPALLALALRFEVESRGSQSQ
jgi:aspartyl-tRNA(Asn)/glutamyl-tRNA(Gln) amidotransferase subunit A